MKLIPTLIFAWLAFGFIQDASAFQCATFSTTGTILTVHTTFYGTSPCTGTQSVVLNSTEFAAFQQLQIDVAALKAQSTTPSVTEFDPILAGQIWMFALTMILGSFLLAKNAGLILEAIKRW